MHRNEPAPKRQKIELHSSASSSLALAPLVPQQRRAPVHPSIADAKRDIGPLPQHVVQRFNCSEEIVKDAQGVLAEPGFSEICSNAFLALYNQSFNERCKITKETLIQLGLVEYVGQPSTDCKSSAYFAHSLLKKLECGAKPITTTAGAAIPWQSPLFWLALANLCSVNVFLFSTAAFPLRFTISDQAPTVAFLHVRNSFSQCSQL
ncbi:hypothetical protein EC968_009939, partial [Mortierella alpina]